MAAADPNQPAQMTSRPTLEIVAHRGASRDCLENTMEAFKRALEQGADAIELDVHATSDGVVVVHHDPHVRVGAKVGQSVGADPLTKTTQIGQSVGSDPLTQTSQIGQSVGSDPLTQTLQIGQGVRSDPPTVLLPAHSRVVVIADTDYATLAQIKLKNGEGIPTLDAVLQLAAGRATVYVEVKGAHIENAVIECLARHSTTKTAVHSFDHRIPHTIGARNNSIPTGILSASYVLDLVHMIRAVGARDLWQQTALIDEALVQAAHAVGARVVAWTENDVEHAGELVQMGVDAICTDTPGVMRAGLTAAGFLTPAPVV